jgi:hypothetical protein
MAWQIALNPHDLAHFWIRSTARRSAGSEIHRPSRTMSVTFFMVDTIAITSTALIVMVVARLPALAELHQRHRLQSRERQYPWGGMLLPCAL